MPPARRRWRPNSTRAWIAYNDANPLLHLVYFNYSVTLRQLGDLAGSIHALRACLKLEPRFGQAHVNLGRALEDSRPDRAGHPAMARPMLDMTAEITPTSVSHRLMVAAAYRPRPGRCRPCWKRRRPHCGRRSSCGRTRRKPASIGRRSASASANGRRWSARSMSRIAPAARCDVAPDAWPAMPTTRCSSWPRPIATARRWSAGLT